MQLEFKSQKGESFTIGSVSFNFLDKRNVFDEFQEDNDYYSDTILKVSGHNTVNLSNKINEVVKENESDLVNRMDILEKIKNLSQFIETSGGITAKIN